MARSTIFKEFYALLKSELDVTVTNRLIYEGDKVPQVVVNAPQLPRQRECFGAESRAYNRDGELEIGIYAATTKEVVELLDLVEEVIFDNLDSFSVGNITVGTSTVADIPLTAKVVRGYILPVAFKFTDD